MASKTCMIIFLSVTAHFAFATAQVEDDVYQNSYTICTSYGNSSSAYRDDVTTLLRSLPSNINNTGFYSSSVGRAHGSALCRADIQLDTCRGCITRVSESILAGKCSTNNVAVMWNNLCVVRFSNQLIFGILAITPQANNSNLLASHVTQPVVEIRKSLIEDLRVKAANGGALRKAAVGTTTAAGGLTVVYAMVQCTPDLSPEDCEKCTADVVQQLSDFSLPWIIFYKPSCTVRFGTDPFYNLTRLQEPLVPVKSSTPSVNSSIPAGFSGNGSGNTSRNIIIIVISIIVFLSAGSCVGLYAMKRIKKKKKEETTKNVDEISSVESIQYDFGQIKDATKNFDDANRLGEGSFGSVYKGILENGGEIAVKRLSEHSWQGDNEFKNEVLLLTKLQHKNLVRLLGFSQLERKEKLLVYEFVQNGSLDHFIFDRTKSLTLDWDKRYKIIGGVARGLDYLHQDSRLQIIHRDLKASNVLLDKDAVPKISDFGLAKLVEPDVRCDRTRRIVGTPGYMAPEYKSDGSFSIKSDVYSFGILVLEIVTGRKVEDINSGDLISDTWRCWRENTSANVIDPNLRAKYGVPENIVRCIQIALSCIERNPDRRPAIAEVVQMLNTSSQTLPVPSEPAFYIPSPFTVENASQDT